MRKKISVVSIVLETSFLLFLVSMLNDVFDYSLRFVILYVMIHIMFGHYRISTLLIWDEIKLLMKSHVCFFFVSLLLIPMNTNGIYSLFISLGITLMMFIFDVLLSRALRIFFRNSCKENVLIIGTGKEAASLQHICKTNRFTLMDVKGVVNVNDKELFPRFHEEVLVEGKVYPVKNLIAIIQNFQIDTVVIAIPDITKQQMDHFMSILYNKVNKIKYLPRANGLVTFDTKVEDFDGVLVISTANGKVSRMSRIMKRLIDIVGGLAGCVLLIPLSLMVRKKNRNSDDYEPILFTQERIGKDGKLFKIYKYRTMVPHAEEVLEDLMKKNPLIKEEYETNKKLRDDPRITKAGKVLREKSLDEFPQFINVVKGEMSLVGPRPYLPREIKDMGMYYSSVKGCTPGVTGMWQSHGRSDVSFEDRLLMDDYYYRNWSIWLDITILIKTVKMVLKGSGAL